MTGGVGITVLPAAGALAAGVALGLVLTGLLQRAPSRGKRSRSRKQAAAQQEAKRPETMKRVIWVCLVNGLAWVWCSYLLAWLDKMQIAESLSQVAVTEIIGVVLAYAVKSTVENLSKNNRWPDGGTGDATDGPSDASFTRG